MKLTEKLTGPVIKLALPTLARHGVAALGGWLAVAQGAGLLEYVTAALALLVTALWSWVERGEPSADVKGMIQQLARALASQAVAFLSGVLLDHGFTGDPNDPVAVLIFAGNYAHSVSQRKQGSSPPVVGGKSEVRRNLFKR
jgi:hypothetical protein